MKQARTFAFAATTTAWVIASMSSTAGGVDDDPPIFGGKIPAGYRDWEMVGVSHEAGNLDEFTEHPGNALAVKAYRDGMLPFPDGAVLARERARPGFHALRAVSSSAVWPDAGVLPRNGGRSSHGDVGNDLRTARVPGCSGANAQAARPI